MCVVAVVCVEGGASLWLTDGFGDEVGVLTGFACARMCGGKSMFKSLHSSTNDMRLNPYNPQPIMCIQILTILNQLRVLKSSTASSTQCVHSNSQPSVYIHILHPLTPRNQITHLAPSCEDGASRPPLPAASGSIL